MLVVKDVATDYLNGEIDVIDLLSDIDFLEEVDQSLVLISKKEIFPDSLIASKRKKLLQKIEILKDEGEVRSGRIQGLGRKQFKSKKVKR